MSTNIFESARLTYRGVMDDDHDAFVQWMYASEQLVGAHGGSLVPASESTKEKSKARLKEHPLCALAVDRASGAVVGFVSLRKGIWPMEYEVGLNIWKEHWGKGYATEIMTWIVNHAFCWMTGVHRVSVDAFASNPAAIAVYKKVGFVQEGVKRKARFAAGKWEDLIELGILEEEWMDRLSKSSTGTEDVTET